MRAARTAFQYPFRREDKPLAKPIAPKGGEPVFRAGGNEAAGRRQEWRDGHAIEHDDPDGYEGRHALNEDSDPPHHCPFPMAS